MNDETLNKANHIRCEMTNVGNMLKRIDNKEAVVDITFSNGNYGCCSCQSDYLSYEEVTAIKAKSEIKVFFPCISQSAYRQYP